MSVKYGAKIKILILVIAYLLISKQNPPILFDSVTTEPQHFEIIKHKIGDILLNNSIQNTDNQSSKIKHKVLFLLLYLKT